MKFTVIGKKPVNTKNGKKATIVYIAYAQKDTIGQSTAACFCDDELAATFDLDGTEYDYYTKFGKNYNAIYPPKAD